MERADVERWCVRSVCGRYRWLLGRRWDRHLPWVVVVGLNPSIADGAVDDPTTRRCIGLARRWGFGGVLLANLYAWRSTDPRGLRDAADPVGRHADRWLEAARRVAPVAVAAWGNHGLGARADAVIADGAWHVLGVTAQGAPRHPLYVPGDTSLRPWQARATHRSSPGR